MGAGKTTRGWILSVASFAVALVGLTPAASVAGSWSPDGQWIAYSFIGGPEHIYLIGADGSGGSELVVREQRDFRPEWAPDGSHLVFTSVIDGVHVMMRVDVDGGNLEQLSETAEAFGDPDYSPDGRRLVFFTDEPRPRDLYVREVANGEITALTSTPDFQEYSPRWAPDGRRVAFVGKEAGESVRGDIWTLDTVSGVRRNVTATPEADEFHPDWSHDGSRVVYIRVVEGRFSVAVREVGSGAETVIADGNGFAVLDPHFSPDDRFIAFTRTDFAEKGPGMPAIVRLELATGRESEIVRGLYLSQMDDSVSD